MKINGFELPDIVKRNIKLEFDSLDKDKNGRISFDEIKNNLTNEWMGNAKTDPDGELPKMLAWYERAYNIADTNKETDKPGLDLDEYTAMVGERFLNDYIMNSGPIKRQAKNPSEDDNSDFTENLNEWAEKVREIKPLPLIPKPSEFTYPGPVRPYPEFPDAGFQKPKFSDSIGILPGEPLSPKKQKELEDAIAGIKLTEDIKKRGQIVDTSTAEVQPENYHPWVRPHIQQEN